MAGTFGLCLSEWADALPHCPAAGTASAHLWLSVCTRALPTEQGFQRAAELAPRCPDAAGALAAWRPLAAAAAAAAGLAEQLSSTSAALRLERVDVALAAADARQRMLEQAEACWAVGAAGHGPAALAAAFAAFSDAQEEAVEALAAQHAQHAQQREGGGGAPAEAHEVAALLESMQRLVLGYASTAVAVRDATSEALFAAPAGGGGGGLLAWLSRAVQAADGINTAASELQLLLPQLLALLYAPEAASQVSAAVAAAAEELDGAASSDDDGAAAAAVGAEERAAAAAMQPLLAAAAQHPALSALLQGLQWAQAAAQALLAEEEKPSLAQEQLLLASAVVATWQELEGAATAAAATAAAAGGGASKEGQPPEPAASEAWQPCSAALAAAVAAEVGQHLLPALASGLAAAARQLREAAPSLAAHTGPAGVSLPAAGPDLVPFTGFDAELPGAGELLGRLEDGLELDAPAGGGRSGRGAAGGGGDALAGAARGPELVPFLDFDDGLAGAGGECGLPGGPACRGCAAQRGLPSRSWHTRALARLRGHWRPPSPTAPALLSAPARPAFQTTCSRLWSPALTVALMAASPTQRASARSRLAAAVTAAPAVRQPRSWSACWPPPRRPAGRWRRWMLCSM